jgi:hypothetical protein
MPMKTENLRVTSFFALLLIAAASVAGVALAGPASASKPLNQVKIGIETTAAIQFQYTVTAYNTSGYQVGTYTGAYPAVDFELPTGTYLITATAYSQSEYFCGVCFSAPSGSANSSGVATPIRYFPPYSEYGYEVVDVTGPAVLSIQTTNTTNPTTSKASIHVQYDNGTAASNAYVYANVVGPYYFDYTNLVMSGQTGADGNVVLLVPDAPIQVNAYVNLPIKLPANQSTVTVTVGGQKVNVTVSFYPNTISLAGQTLLLPPQTDAKIVLEYQQPYAGPIYYGSGTGNAVTGPPTGITTTTITSTAGVSPGQQTGSAVPTKIAPFAPGPGTANSAAGATPAPGDMLTGVLPTVAVAAAATLAGTAFALLIKKKQP